MAPLLPRVLQADEVPSGRRRTTTCRKEFRRVSKHLVTVFETTENIKPGDPAITMDLTGC